MMLDPTDLIRWGRAKIARQQVPLSRNQAPQRAIPIVLQGTYDEDSNGLPTAWHPPWTARYPPFTEVQITFVTNNANTDVSSRPGTGKVWELVNGILSSTDPAGHAYQLSIHDGVDMKFSLLHYTGLASTSGNVDYPNGYPSNGLDTGWTFASPVLISNQSGNFIRQQSTTAAGKKDTFICTVREWNELDLIQQSFRTQTGAPLA